MAKKDKRVDAYIEKAQPFAKPILKHLRKLVHTACPDAEETIKWGMPSFDYKGAFCSMASFKQHAVFGFWKSKLMDDPKGYLGERKAQGGEAMGNLGRIASVKDLPPDKALISLIKQAARLNDANVKLPARKKTAVNLKAAPGAFLALLKKNKQAWKVWEAWTPGKRKEYIDWVTEAKTEETRNKRMQTAVEWIAEGKIRNWKYQKK